MGTVSQVLRLCCQFDEKVQGFLSRPTPGSTALYRAGCDLREVAEDYSCGYAAQPGRTLSAGLMNSYPCRIILYGRLEGRMANETRRENLKIVEFAGIKSLDIDLANLTLILGPQSVGKSITLKLIYFFRNLQTPIFKFYAVDADQTDESEKYTRLKESITDLFLKLFPIRFYHKYCRDCTLIRYSFYHLGSLQKLDIRIKGKDEVFFDDYGLLKKIQDSFNTINNRNFNASDDLSGALEKYPIPLAVFQEKLNSFFPNEQNIYIPSGRSFFSNIDDNPWFLFSNGEQLFEPFFTMFGMSYVPFRKKYRDILPSLRLIQRIFNGVYISEPGNEYIKQNDGRQIDMGFASSGQQELVPLAIILEVLYASPPGLPMNIYIEEPEAHLFPDAQKETVDAIARVLNLLTGSDGVKIFLSSHSPYVMTSFNNLLKAGKIIEDNPEKSDDVDKIIPKDTALKPGTAAAYLLDGNSESRPIMTKNGLIDAEAVDSVSERIMEEFDRLLELTKGVIFSA